MGYRETSDDSLQQQRSLSIQDGESAGGPATPPAQAAKGNWLGLQSLPRGQTDSAGTLRHQSLCLFYFTV